MSPPDLIDRTALVAFMDRVLSAMEADPLSSGNGAYLRGYRAALAEVKTARAVVQEGRE